MTFPALTGINTVTASATVRTDESASSTRRSALPGFYRDVKDALTRRGRNPGVRCGAHNRNQRHTCLANENFYIGRRVSTSRAVRRGIRNGNMRLGDCVRSGINKRKDSARRQAGKHRCRYYKLASPDVRGRLLGRKHNDQRNDKTNRQNRIILSSLHWSTSCERFSMGMTPRPALAKPIIEAAKKRCNRH